jgi:hypothetical protein
MNTLTIGYIAKTAVNALFMESLMGAIPVIGKALRYKILVKSLLGKSNLPHARSILVTEWFDQAAPGDLFMFIDTDQTFTHTEITQVVRQRGDLRAGIYANRGGQPTSVPATGGRPNALRYAATGFLCFTYEAAAAIHTSIKHTEGHDRVVISDNAPREQNVIPFFQPLLVRTAQQTYWLGEDFSFSHRANEAGLKIVGIPLRHLGHEVSNVIYYTPPKLPPKPITYWPKDSVVYYCGPSRVEFSPLDSSLGGAEQAVVYLSALLQRSGKQATVYGNVNPAVHAGVVYKSYEEFAPTDSFNTLILWRGFGLTMLSKVKRVKQLLIDLHDPTDPHYLKPPIKATIMVKSNFHRSLYADSDLPNKQFVVVPNGLRVNEILSATAAAEAAAAHRDTTRFCYTSSYDRGLIPILKYMWPRIIAAIPTATFHIHYGSIDPLQSELLDLLAQPGVHEHGRSSYEETLRERTLSVAQLYFSSSPAEIDCIAIREAALLGCIPIISHYAVFTERTGIHVQGDPATQAAQEAAADVAINVSRMSEERRKQFVEALKKDALATSWPEVAAQWLAIIEPKKPSHTIETKIVVFVPYCDFFEQTIVKCLESINRQKYTAWEVIVVNDGSTQTDHIAAYVRDKPNITLYSPGPAGSKGPAASKWYFLDYIQQNVDRYSVNDICMIVDGDDHLITDEAFTAINETYQKNKCWVTYGNAEGNFCERANNEIPDTWTEIRTQEWIYNHPRTFKLALALTFREEDFKIGGEWLVKGTDRPIVYNTIEMAGRNRTKFIDRVLYGYLEHDHNTYKVIPPEFRRAQIAYVQALRPKSRIEEEIHIVMCCWKRPENLPIQLENLNSQTVASRIHLHLLNNSVENREVFEDIVARSLPTSNIKISLTHYNNQYYGFQRFLYTRDTLLRSYNIDHVIFMDDDQLYLPSWAENLYNSRKPETYMAWYCKSWTRNSLNYWKPPSQQADTAELHYGGTGGSIIDTTVFRQGSKLWELPQDLHASTTIYNIEDLWLSFIIRKIYGWTIERSPYKEACTLNSPNSDSAAAALYVGLRSEKQQLLEYLVAKYGL